MAIGFTNISTGGGVRGLSAQPQDVRMGMTFTTDSKTVQTGTMNLVNLVPENIKKDVNIGGVVGAFKGLHNIKKEVISVPDRNVEFGGGNSYYILGVVPRYTIGVRVKGIVRVFTTISRRGKVKGMLSLTYGGYLHDCNDAFNVNLLSDDHTYGQTVSGWIDLVGFSPFTGAQIIIGSERLAAGLYDRLFSNNRTFEEMLMMISNPGTVRIMRFDTGYPEDGLKLRVVTSNCELHCYYLDI